MVDDNDIGNASGSDLIERPFHIFIDADDSDDILYTLKHELGHVLFHEEHYASFPFGACDTDWASIMNQFNCLGNLHVSPHDAVDFFGAYQPKDSPKPASMSPSSSSAVQFTWSSAESTRHNLSRYLSQKLSDRNGTLLVETVSNAIPEFGTVTGGISYSIGTSGGTISRFCVRTAGTTNAGYQGLSALTPFTPHGCASRSLSPYPTSFIATSEVSSSGSAIVTRLRNGASATRYFQITGPGLENLGSCSNVPYRTVGANGGTNNCSISYGTADNHDRLAVFVWNSSSGGTLIAAITLDTDAK